MRRSTPMNAVLLRSRSDHAAPLEAHYIIPTVRHDSADEGSRATKSSRPSHRQKRKSSAESAVCYTLCCTISAQLALSPGQASNAMCESYSTEYARQLSYLPAFNPSHPPPRPSLILLKQKKLSSSPPLPPIHSSQHPLLSPASSSRSPFPSPPPLLPLSPQSP